MSRKTSALPPSATHPSDMETHYKWPSVVSCIKKAPADVHREAQLEGNGPSLVKSWNEAADFWWASRRVGRHFSE
ncbi:MAG: hypothetical protein P8X79_01195 [Reinekea sp.]